MNLTADKVKEIKFSDNLPTDSSYTKVDNLDYDADGKLTTPISSVLGIVNIAVEEKYGGGWESNIQNPVYMWYDATNEVINLKTPSGGVYLNKNSGNMFNGYKNLSSVDLSKFDSSKVTEMYSIFANCSSLKSLDLSNFNTSNVVNIHGLFNGANSLETIYVSDKFVTNNVTRSGNMFYGCNNLVGGQGTVYDANNLDKTYARIDNTNNGKPGYFTDIKDKP